MNSPITPHLRQRSGTWLLGALAFLVCASMGPATAFAGVDQGCDELGNPASEGAEETSPSASAGSEEKQSHNRPPATERTPATTRGLGAPCAFSESDSPSFNACFAANPQPVSAMPKWIAAMQAEEAVATVFSEINDIYEEPSQQASGRPLWQASAPVWLDDVIDELRRTEIPSDPGRVCIDNDYDEQCHSLPPSAVIITAGTLSPMERPSEEIKLPWQPDEDDQAQPALVELRVGPSDEHNRLPERPPEV